MKKALLIISILINCINLDSQSLHKQFKELPCVNKNFNVHFHVVRDSFRKVSVSMGTILGIINSANRAFEPICASFSFCCLDTIDNYSFDSIYNSTLRSELISKHSNKNVINVYFVNFILREGVCGLSGIDMLLNKKCPGSFTHELGHTFGLPHTFEGGNELVDGSNCDVAGDLICDTPADPYTNDPSIVWTKDCEFIFKEKDKNGDYYQPDVGNIMSYLGCDCGFTRDQYLIMAKSILSSLNLW